MSERSAAGWLGIGIRGVAMGMAEVVPGVSGGTIAFVTGIYDELIQTLAGFNFKSVRQVIVDPAGFWRDHNLSFLACLGLGMVISIVLFAHLIKVALEQTPTLVWGFFFGLIAVSVVVLARGRELRPLLTLGVLGVVAGLAISSLTPGQMEPGHGIFFIGGAIAVCAWVLPAVSGSFMLLVMGIYQPVIEAIAGVQLTLLGALAAGCVIGILFFSKLLAWLMVRYSEPVLSLLTGFMLGAMIKLWPWRVENALTLPDTWQQLTQQDSMPLATVGAMVAGGLTLWLLTRLTK